MSFRSLLQEESLWVRDALLSPWFAAGMAVVAGWAHTAVGLGVPHGMALLGLGALLLVLSVVDSRYRLMPITVNMGVGISGLAWAIWGVGVGAGGATPLAAVLGFVVAFGGLWACAGLTERITGKESLGGADIWLAGGIGAWGGVGALPMLLVMVAVLGLGVVVVRRLQRKTGPFAFGPVLALAGWVAVLHAPLYWHVLNACVSALV